MFHKIPDKLNSILFMTLTTLMGSKDITSKGGPAFPLIKEETIVCFKGSAHETHALNAENIYELLLIIGVT